MDHQPRPLFAYGGGGHTERKHGISFKYENPICLLILLGENYFDMSLLPRYKKFQYDVWIFV